VWIRFFGLNFGHEQFSVIGEFQPTVGPPLRRRGFSASGEFQPAERLVNSSLQIPRKVLILSRGCFVLLRTYDWDAWIGSFGCLWMRRVARSIP